jgi:hypothetical protein
MPSRFSLNYLILESARNGIVAIPMHFAKLRKIKEIIL